MCSALRNSEVPLSRWFKYGKKIRHTEQQANLLPQINKFQASARRFCRYVQTDDCPEAHTVHLRNISQVQNHAPALDNERLNLILQKVSRTRDQATATSHEHAIGMRLGGQT